MRYIKCSTVHDTQIRQSVTPGGLEPR